MRIIVMMLTVAAIVAAPGRDVLAQDPALVVSFHLTSIRGGEPGIATMRNVRAVVGSIQIETEEAELSMADGRLRLVLKGGGTVMLPQRSRVEVVTGPYERMQRDEGLTRMLQSILLRLPRQPPDFILPLG